MDLDKISSLRTDFGEIYDENFKLKDKTKLVDFNKELEKIGISSKLTPKEIELKLQQAYEELMKVPTNTTLTPEQLKDFGEQAAIQKQKYDETIKNQKEAVAKFKEAGEKRYQDQQKENEAKQKILDQKIQDTINNKKVVVVPAEQISTVTLDDPKKETILTFSKTAKEDPYTLEQFIETKIKESLVTAADDYKENITPDVIKKSATSITENFASLNYENISEIPTNVPVMHPASPFVALTLLNDAKLKGLVTDDEVRQKIVQMSQALALGLEAEANVNFASAKAVFNSEEIASIFYGPADGHITQFEIAEDQEGQKDDGVEFNLKDLYDNGKKYYEFYEKVREARTAQEVTSTGLAYYPTYTRASVTVAAKTTSTLVKALPYIGAYSGLRTSVLATQWVRGSNFILMPPNIAGLIGNGGIQQATIMSSPIIYNRPFVIASRSGSLKFAIGTGKTVQGQMVLKTGLKIGQSSLITTTTATGTSVSTATGFFAKALTFIGGLSGWVTAGIGLVVGYVAGKIIEKLPQIKKWFQENGPVLAIFTGLGGALAFGAGPGVFIGIGTAVALGSAGALVTGAFGVLGFIGRSVGIAIATPVIVTLLVLPPLVAFIMLVINNSAYVVPPSFESGGGGYTPTECLGEAPEKPTATNIKYSSDGKYAYPVAPFEVPGYVCYHWDGNKATDIFSPQNKPPMVAYESGTITNVTLNDSLGGKYIILRGASGRHYYYAHLCHVFVGSGETVGVGDVIATMDETGSGRVQHLHYAINEPPLNDTFIGGDGNVCPQEDFEEKFGFGVCNTGNYCVSP